MTRPSTKLLHHGEHPGFRDRVVPTTAPISVSTTHIYARAADLDKAFDATANGGADAVYYIRHGSPNTRQLEDLMCALDGGRGAVATSSGMSALYLALLAAGTPRGESQPQTRHVLASNDLYGADHVLLRDFFAVQKTQVSYCDFSDLAAVSSALDAHEPDVLLCESISNPLLKLVDIDAIAQLAHNVDARLIVDATLATPMLQQPLARGADLVVHSATKYLGGHADALGGIVIARAKLVADTLSNYAHTLGINLGAHEAHAITRGMKTLHLRMQRQCESAHVLALRLSQLPAVTRVIYPGLDTHPQHALAQRQLRGGYGGMLSLELADATRARVFEVMDAFKLILPATSLGDVYTLVTYPPLSSHRDLSAAQRHAQGIGDGLLRISIGIEDVEDIWEDFEQALA